MFDHHLPAKWREWSPQSDPHQSGRRRWSFQRSSSPCGAEPVAGRPKESTASKPTAFDEMRPVATTFTSGSDMTPPGCWARFASLLSPASPGDCSPTTPTRSSPRTSSGPNDWHSTNGRGLSAVIPMALPRSGAQRSAPRGCAGARTGLPPILHRTRPSWARPTSQDYWDPLWEAFSDTGHSVLRHLGSSADGHYRTRCSLDVMIQLQP